MEEVIQDRQPFRRGGVHLHHLSAIAFDRICILIHGKFGQVLYCRIKIQPGFYVSATHLVQFIAHRLDGSLACQPLGKGFLAEAENHSFSNGFVFGVGHHLRCQHIPLEVIHVPAVTFL